MLTLKALVFLTLFVNTYLNLTVSFKHVSLRNNQAVGKPVKDAYCSIELTLELTNNDQQAHDLYTDRGLNGHTKYFGRSAAVKNRLNNPVNVKNISQTIKANFTIHSNLSIDQLRATPILLVLKDHNSLVNNLEIMDVVQMGSVNDFIKDRANYFVKNNIQSSGYDPQSIIKSKLDAINHKRKAFLELINSPIFSDLRGNEQALELISRIITRATREVVNMPIIFDSPLLADFTVTHNSFKGAFPNNSLFIGPIDFFTPEIKYDAPLTPISTWARSKPPKILQTVLISI